MKNLVLFIIYLGLIFIFSVSGSAVVNNTSAPTGNWMQYKNPEEVGWSLEKLNEAHDYYKKIGCAAAMLVYKGKVVIAWGDINRNYLCHSVRKSFLSALYGIYVGKGKIDINKTLADISFKDAPPLNKQEKQATIENLLTCTSGIARQGSNEGDWGIGEPHKPGEVFHYNNWTFNALGGIFNQQTDSDLFKDFNNEIVKQIGMQDFNLNNTWYQYNNKIDMYPKYGFKMSARDMARFGLLYLNKGNWNGKQIIPEKWVAESTKTHVKTGIKPFNGYGYLWWTSNTGYFKEYPVYSALGVGENTINVCNKKNVVFITRVNTYNPKFKYVSHQQMLELLKMLLKAKINDSILNPELVKLPDSKSKIKKLNLSSLELMRFTGKYIFRKNKMWSKAMIKLQDNQLFIQLLPTGIKFQLIPISKNKFLIKDIETKLLFQTDEFSNIGSFKFNFGDSCIEATKVMK